MIRPATASVNPETAGTNAFQGIDTPDNALDIVQSEFDNAVKLLRNAGVNVTVINDTTEPPTPDAMFPNNWFSTSSGQLFLYPMLAKNRQAEAKTAPLTFLFEKYSTVCDLRHLPPLEGTGALVLDHINHHAFIARSLRANLVTITEWATKSGYSFTKFSTADKNGHPIYHTNVVMAIGTNWAIIATDSIVDSESRLEIYERLETREIIEITHDQMNAYAGNMLELRSTSGNKVITMSKSAYDSLQPFQREALQKHGELLPISIPTIEYVGGGSIRCMIAELF